MEFRLHVYNLGICICNVTPFISSQMINQTFSFVANSLLWVGRKTGLTSNKVNILVYYLLIPLSWTIMFDCSIKKQYTTAVLAFT